MGSSRYMKTKGVVALEDQPKWKKVIDKEETRMTMLFVASEAGDKIVYHIGYLPRDCLIGDKADVAKCIGRRSAAQKAQEKGLCLLYQRRMGEDMYEYIMHKLPPEKYKRRD